MTVLHLIPRDTRTELWIAALRCRLIGHDWHYDAEESAGPWTGYIERCSKCGALCQVPQ